MCPYGILGIFRDISGSLCALVPLSPLKYPKRELGTHAKPTGSWHSDHIHLLIKFISSETLIYLKCQSKIYVAFEEIINGILEIADDIL